MKNLLMNPAKSEFTSDPFNWISSIVRIKPGGNAQRSAEKLEWMLDGKQPYETNSFGYRSDEFIESRDMIFAGCSVTWGEGVIKDGIWGNILSKEIGLSSYNLGVGGKGVPFIVTNLIDFFTLRGNPKVLFCLFPDFTRIDMKSDTNFMVGKYAADENKNMNSRSSYNLLLTIRPFKGKEKYSKVPHIAEEIIPAELIFSINLEYIKLLEAYCRTNEIQLFWGTWDPHQDRHLSENVSFTGFKNYVYLDQDKWEQRKIDNRKVYFHKDGELCAVENFPCVTHEMCHEEYKEQYKENFDLAMDSGVNNRDSNFGHYGAHRHIHIAEGFAQAYREYNIN